MNKKGFTLVELLAVLSLMVIIMSFAFPSVLGMIRDNENKKYEAYEESMIEYAKAHFDERTDTIGLSELTNVGLTLNDTCTGYIIMPSLKAYLKCGDDYETTGYDDSKAF